ncbi:SigE family RNA polymerase sigma factor [Nocardioides sp. NPDC087217]|uniref:SigE family RNA polymerase sigma factor n=1 Tax=Nocardioides sp. NPDC087217 TaxID=3364335 RepID=UPI00380F8104
MTAQLTTGADGARDDAAFTEYVTARLPHLLKVGRALAGDEQRGADLVQDALERTLLHWRNVRDPDAFVRRAMVNRSVSVWRKQRRERPLTEMREPVGSDRTPDHDLLEAVRRLPPRQRAVIVLRYYEDITEAQTAEALGCSVGTVKSQAHQAMKALRAELSNYADREETS